MKFILFLDYFGIETVIPSLAYVIVLAQVYYYSNC